MIFKTKLPLIVLAMLGCLVVGCDEEYYFEDTGPVTYEEQNYETSNDAPAPMPEVFTFEKLEQGGRQIHSQLGSTWSAGIQCTRGSSLVPSISSTTMSCNDG